MHRRLSSLYIFTMSTADSHPTRPSPPPLTASDVLLLAESPTSTLPSHTPHTTLLSHLYSLPPTISITKYLTSLLTLISRTSPSPSLSTFLSSLLLSFIRLTHSREIPLDPTTNANAHVLHLFSLRLHTLSKPQLVSILDLLISTVPSVIDSDDALPLDLLPRCLHLAQESVGVVIDSLLLVEWSKAAVVKMVSMLKEFPVGVRDRVPEFLGKVFGGISAVDIQDLPSLVYQLLLLAAKVFCRRQVMEGIMAFFGGGLIKGTPGIVRQVEGTVLMHVNFAVKQDPSLVPVVIAIVRSEPGVFNHFAILIVLSIARIRRFNETAIGLLKSVIVTSYDNYKVARGCKWFPNSLKEECLEIVKCIEKALMRVVNESNYGREQIVSSVIQLGFVLLESIDGEKSRNEMFDDSEELMGIEELSIQVLKTMFEVHDIARDEIIKQLELRILSLKPQQSLAVIKLLGILVEYYPYPMLEHVARLKELLDYFTFLHDRAALAVITNMLPLTKFSRDLQDYIILVLRKAVFRREDTIRLAAANAIVDLILMETKSKNNGADSLKDSSSQASCSQQSDLCYRMEFGLFQELTGLLRRCLSHEATVRETIYHGLVKLVIVDPFVAGDVFYFLWPHFLKFYREGVEFPVCIDSCIKLANDKVCIEEPLDCLLSCVSWILLLQSHSKANFPSEFSWGSLRFSLSQDNEATKIPSAEAFSIAFLRIRKALRSVSLEDILGQSPESSSNALNREKTTHYMWILSKILEVFINIVTIDLEKAAESEKEEIKGEIMDLISLYESLDKEKFINYQRNISTKGSARNQQNRDNQNDCHVSVLKLSQERRPFLATSSISHLLIIALEIYSATFPFAGAVSQNQNKSPVKTFDNCLKLISFTLMACRHQIYFFSLVGNDDPLKSLMNGDIKSVGRPLLQLVWFLRSGLKLERDQNIKESKGKKIAGNNREQLSLALTCMNELFIACSDSVYFADLIQSLVTLRSSGMDLKNKDIVFEGMEVEQGLEANLQGDDKTNFFLEKTIRPLYLELLEFSLFQECEILSDMMLTIANKLVGSLKDSHGIWAESICRCIYLKNFKTARKVLGLTVLLRLPPNDLVVAHTMAAELLKVMCSVEDVPIKESETYPIVNHLTANGIASELLQLIESVLMELNWALSKMKLISVGNHEINGTEKVKKYWNSSSGMLFDEAFCSRSQYVVNILSYFAEMKLKDSQVDQFLKLNTKFYKILSQMTKSRIALKRGKEIFPGEIFQKLVEGTCIKLTAPLYTFVAMMQEKQQNNAQSRGTANRIKKENRRIPDLIFQIEEYEKFLIRLSKQSKVNLLRHAKLSTARDFKIKGFNKNTRQDEKAIEEHGEEEKIEEPGKDGSLSSQQDYEVEELADQEDNSGCENDVPECNDDGGPAVEDSESEKEDMYIRRKRSKISNIVQDSDED